MNESPSKSARGGVWVTQIVPLILYPVLTIGGAWLSPLPGLGYAFLFGLAAPVGLTIWTWAIMGKSRAVLPRWWPAFAVVATIFYLGFGFLVLQATIGLWASV